MLSKFQIIEKCTKSGFYKPKEMNSPRNHRNQHRNKKSKSPAPRKCDDTTLIKAAQVLVSEDVDLSSLPDTDEKEEFLELAELAIHDKANSLQKARLEYLSNKMEEDFERLKNQSENDRKKEEDKQIRDKKEKNRRLLRMKTKRGQPILKNLARIQYQQVKAMIANEKK